IAHVAPIQRKLKQRMGAPFTFLGDEIYIMAGARIPPATHYTVFPQMEKGGAMGRRVLTQLSSAMRTKPNGPVRATVCTGKVFYPYLKGCIDRLGMDLKTVAVESKFWGSGIGVAGLLTGGDFIAALEGKVYGDFVVVPSECMVGD